MLIKLVRHATSEFNAGLLKPGEVPNHKLQVIEPSAYIQCKCAARLIGKEFLKDAILYASPYTRTYQTMNKILGVYNLSNNKVYYDPRLREIDFGYGDSEAQKAKRDEEGKFWYRYDGGESGADCFDRVSSFIESMMRQVKRKKRYGLFNRNVVIVTHSIVIRCFVMRFFHLHIKEYESMISPENCDIITIGKKEKIQNPQFVMGRWAVEGLKLR